MKNFFYLKTSKQDSIYARTAHGTHPVTRVSNVIRGEAVFDTLGKTESAHHAGGPTPYKGWVPLLRWVRGGRGEFPPLPHHKRGIFPSFAVGERGEKCKKADSHRYHQFEWQIAPRPCFVNKTISHVEWRERIFITELDTCLISICEWYSFTPIYLTSSYISIWGPAWKQGSIAAHQLKRGQLTC